MPPARVSWRAAKALSDELKSMPSLSARGGIYSAGRAPASYLLYMHFSHVHTQSSCLPPSIDLTI
jgi:hypothetical protein